MKKSALWISLLLVLILSGCSTNNEDAILAELENFDVQRVKDEVTAGDFVYRLFTEKEEYSSSKDVNMYAELEYIGESDKITIFHAASPFYFPIEEKIRGIQIPYPMPEPLLSRTVKKGEPFREEYKSSGAYSEEDDKEYKDFMKDFIQNGFPLGYYVVDGYADFFFETNPNKEPEKFHPSAQIDFKVK